MSKELRALAMAANRTCTLNHKQISWFEQTELLDGTVDHSDDAAYIAAASPDIVLSLLDRIDHLELHIKHIGNDALRTKCSRQEKLLREALEALRQWTTPNWAGSGVDQCNAAFAAIEKELK